MKKLNRWTFVVGSLSLLLAACGGSKTGGNDLIVPGTPVQPSASVSDTRSVATDVSQSSMVAFGQTQTELQALLTDLDMPSGAAAASLMTAQMLGQQAVGMVQMLSSGKSEALKQLQSQMSIASTYTLQRGDYDCTVKGQPCSKKESDDYVIRWKTKSGKVAVFMQDWDGSSTGQASPTVLAHNGSFDQAGNVLTEQPTKLVLDLNVGGETLGNATILIGYLPSSCLSGKVLMGFYTSVGAKGFFGKPGGLKMVEGEANYSLDVKTGKFATKGNVNAQGGNEKVKAVWDVSASLTLSPVPNSCGMVQMSGNPKDVSFSAAVENTKHSLGLAFKASNFQSGQQGMSVDFSDGVLKMDNKFVTFSGTLDDANKNCIPGENLTLKFGANQTMTLEEFLKVQFQMKACTV